MARRGGQHVDPVRAAQRRQALSLTQTDAAEKLGIHRVTVTKIENGDANVSLELLERMAALYGCTREHLLGEPEQVDPLDQARAAMTEAIQKIAGGFHELTDLVETLNNQIREKVAA